MSAIDRATATQIANIERATGRSLAEWAQLIADSGLEKHGQIVAMLQQHGLTYGNANTLAHKARELLAGGEPSGDDLVAAQYAGRNAGLRPLYESVLARVRQLGPDIELAPKKAYVSLRRRKQFAQLGPAAGQLEVCLNLPGKPATERLRPTSGMATHRVRIADVAGLDGELLGWLKEAYDRAG
ncbi:MAG TPA: DUF5655 domain-containing protein [Candidatus Limnocylindrales bacterium]